MSFLINFQKPGRSACRTFFTPVTSLQPTSWTVTAENFRRPAAKMRRWEPPAIAGHWVPTGSRGSAHTARARDRTRRTPVTVTERAGADGV